MENKDYWKTRYNYIPPPPYYYFFKYNNILLDKNLCGVSAVRMIYNKIIFSWYNLVMGVSVKRNGMKLNILRPCIDMLFIRIKKEDYKEKKWKLIIMIVIISALNVMKNLI